MPYFFLFFAGGFVIARSGVGVAVDAGFLWIGAAAAGGFGRRGRRWWCGALDDCCWDLEGRGFGCERGACACPCPSGCEYGV